MKKIRGIQEDTTDTMLVSMVVKPQDTNIANHEGIKENQ